MNCSRVRSVKNYQLRWEHLSHTLYFSTTSLTCSHLAARYSVGNLLCFKNRVRIVPSSSPFPAGMFPYAFAAIERKCVKTGNGIVRTQRVLMNVTCVRKK